MKLDERARRAAEDLRASAQHVDPSPWDKLRRRSATKRLAKAALGVALLIAVSVGVLAAIASERSTPVAVDAGGPVGQSHSARRTDAGSRFVNPQSGIRLDVPKGFHLTALIGDAAAIPIAAFSTDAHPLGISLRIECPPLESREVIVGFYEIPSENTGRPATTGASIPKRDPEVARQVGCFGQNRSVADAAPKQYRIRTNGRSFIASIRSAPDAPPATRRAAEELLTSMRVRYRAQEDLPRCGASLPKGITPPDGFVGPRFEAVASPRTPVEPGQLVLSWSRGTSQVEVRWPADARNTSRTAPRDPPSSPGDPAFSGGHETAATQLPDGRYTSEGTFTFGDLQPACQHVQVDVYDVSEPAVGAVASPMWGHPLGQTTEPIVDHAETVSSIPSAAPCPTPPGVMSPNRGGDVQNPAFGSPREALRAFVRADSSLAQDSYVELRAPDGSLSFGHRDFKGDKWVTVVRVSRTPEGWTVDHWDGSGC